jgi:hypothetical protein
MANGQGDVDLRFPQVSTPQFSILAWLGWLLTVEQLCVRLRRRLSYNIKLHLTEADCEDMSRIVWDGQKTQRWACVVINRNLRFNNEGINTKEIFTGITAYATWNLRVPYNVFYSDIVKMFVLLIVQ